MRLFYSSAGATEHEEKQKEKHNQFTIPGKKNVKIIQNVEGGGLQTREWEGVKVINGS